MILETIFEWLKLLITKILRLILINFCSRFVLLWPVEWEELGKFTKVDQTILVKRLICDGAVVEFNVDPGFYNFFLFIFDLQFVTLHKCLFVFCLFVFF